MNRNALITLFGLFLHMTLHGQAVLDQYVKTAIAQNQSVAEKKAIERKHQYSLDHAGKLFGPEVHFLTSYTLASGGRSIEFPVGLLLNDVYSTLNNLTGTQNFQQVNNETISFLPNNFYDARLRITQPILQPEIKYNKWIKEEEKSLAGLQTHQTIRDLIRDVKTGYIQWLQTRQVLAIIDQGLTLLNENKRISESLLKNGQAIPSAVMRIDSEIARVNAQRQKAESDITNAASYFNFLLNQPAGTLIREEVFAGIPDVPTPAALTSREELQQIQTGQQIQSLALKLEQKQHAPTLGVQVDIGSQAYAPDWGSYVLGGIQLEIPLWDNQKSKLKQKEWQAQLDATQAKYEWTKNAFEVQLKIEIENLQTDIAIYQSYTALLQSNQRYYQETLRRYKEGLAGYIELLDARTEVTNTQLEQNLAKYRSWLRFVTIERIAASAPIE